MTETPFCGIRLLALAGEAMSPRPLRTQRSDLAGEPPEASSPPVTDAAPYRRLIRMCSQVLGPDGALVVQFHRRVLVSEATQLSQLRLAA
jgi:hypothetical protein